MQCVTTNSIDGKVVLSYRGVVAAEVVFGVNFIRDLAASFTDAVGGRSTTYEKEFEGARKTAVEILTKKAEAMRADAIVGMRFEYQVLGEKNGMMMVAAYGTAVQLTKSDQEKTKDEERVSEDRAMYFVTIGTSEKGPFSLAQLRELVRTGRVEESSSVRTDGRDGSKLLGDILG